MISNPMLSELLARWFERPDGIGSFIGDQPVAGDGDEISLVNPADEAPLACYRDAGPAIVRQATAAARRGFGVWQGQAASARGRVLWAVGQAIRADAEPLARLEALTAGKPIRDTRIEVLKVAEMFEYYAGWCDKLHGDVIPVPTSHLNYTRREPYGVVAQLTPWNAPIFTAGWQVAPALAAGNAVVLKPSEFTPFSSLALARLALHAGVPAGVFNVINGLGTSTGDTLVRDPEVRKIIFVGSASTGRVIAHAAATNLTPTLLELGGKSANIVFADADLQRAALGAQAAIFAGAGQSCVAGSRLLVQASIHGEMVERLATAARRIAVGPPLAEATQVGPINNRRQLDRIASVVEAGRAAGAELAAGGVRPPGLNSGYYYAPTVLTGVRNDMAVARDEIFGPVLAVIPFAEDEEAVAIANDTAFGLAGAVWTGDVGRAHRIAAQVRAGTFWINGYKTISVMSPFGGFRGSGHGRSSGLEGLHEYTQTKSVWVETAANPAQAFGYSPE